MTAIPHTRKRRKYNPEKRTWRGRSHRKGGQRVRDLRGENDMGDTFYRGTFYRGITFGSHTISEGDCFTDQPISALAYCRGRKSGFVLEVEIPLECLTVEEVEAQVDCPWPGDLASERHAYAARGVDVITYRDLGADAHGREIQCWRLVSERAVAAASVRTVWSHEAAMEEWGWLA